MGVRQGRDAGRERGFTEGEAAVVTHVSLTRGAAAQVVRLKWAESTAPRIIASALMNPPFLSLAPLPFLLHPQQNPHPQSEEHTDVDRFSLRQAVILIAATNRPDELDEGLTKAGRIDRELHVGLPSEEQRCAIFQVHSRGRQLAPSVDFSKAGAPCGRRRTRRRSPGTEADAGTR